MGVRISSLAIFSVLSMSGCATWDFAPFSSGAKMPSEQKFSKYENNYLFEPSVVQRGEADGNRITDRTILSFSDDVKNALRRRMNRARIARMFSGTIQVLTAATAAGLAASSANLTTIAALSGTSAIMPQLQDLFDARERAEAYDQGANLIEKAQVRYFSALTTGAADLASTGNRPSAAAVQLFDSTVAALSVVETVLISHLPSVEDLKRATGEYDQIELVPDSVSVAPGEKTMVYIAGAGPVTSVTIQDPTVASAVLNGRAIEITAGKGAGVTTNLVVTDTSGVPHSVQVAVKAPAPVGATATPAAPVAPANTTAGSPD